MNLSRDLSLDCNVVKTNCNKTVAVKILFLLLLLLLYKLHPVEGAKNVFPVAFWDVMSLWKRSCWLAEEGGRVEEKLISCQGVFGDATASQRAWAQAVRQYRMRKAHLHTQIPFVVKYEICKDFNLPSDIKQRTCSLCKRCLTTQHIVCNIPIQLKLELKHERCKFTQV